MTSPSEAVGSLGQAIDLYADSSRAYLTFFGTHAASSGQVRQAVDSLIAKANAASANFLESLANLQPMVEDLGPEVTAPGGDAVCLTLVSILVKHMSNYHRDVAAALDSTGAALSQGKRQLTSAATTQPSSVASAAAQHAGTLASTAASSILNEVKPVAAVAATGLAVAAAVLNADGPMSDHDDVAAPEKKKKKKKKKVAGDELPTPPIEVPPAVVEQPRETAASPTGAAGRRKAPSSEAAQSSSSVVSKPSPGSPKNIASKKSRPRTEAEFLAVQKDVTTTIADTLLSMPTVFSPFEKIVAKSAASGEYFLEPTSEDPSSLANLGAFFTRIWLQGVLQDLYLDLLEVDHVDIPLFSGVTGNVMVDSEDDLTGLPSAGFRRISTDEITVHSCFAFIDSGAHGLKRCLIVHDAVIQGGRKEEMIQVFRPIAEGQSNIIQVQFYAYNGAKKLPKGSKSEAFVITVKDVIIEAGGVEEANEEEARDIIQAANTPEPEGGEDADEAPPASGSTDELDERFKTKAPDKSSFMQKALRISKKVVAAPLSLGVAAGAAVFDAAGGVVKVQTDGLFRKHFPQHAAEVLVDSFSCALSNGPIVKQGYLYATSTWLCFKGTVLDATLEIPFDEIREFRKANTGAIFPTAIEVYSFTNEKHVFTSFIQRDEALKTLHKIWTESDGLK